MCYTYVALLKEKHNLNFQATSFVVGTLKPSSKALGTKKLEVVVYTVSIGKKIWNSFNTLKVEAVIPTGC